MNSNSGNVLFLILIAVALFAALSYAVTSSNRSGGGAVSKEKAQANASSLVQYYTSLRSAVMRMKLSNGCLDTQLDFTNTIYKKGDGTALQSANTFSPVNKTCHLFDASGGGMIPVILASSSLDPNNAFRMPGHSLPGHGAVRIGQIKGVGTDGSAGDQNANDINISWTWLNHDTCIAINELLGISNPSGYPPVVTFSGSGGSLTSGVLSGTQIITSQDTDGNPAFCSYYPPEKSYRFDGALVER